MADAIRSEDDNNLIEELGDLLLQIILQAQIASEKKRFCFKDIVKVLRKKLIRRHPHVFNQPSKKTLKEIEDSWEEIKRQEKNNQNSKTPITDELKEKVKSQEALAGAMIISKKVAKVGFEWEGINDVWKKFDEEVKELKIELIHKQHKRAEEELGDVFFTLVNIARWSNLNPEEGIASANRRFLERFCYMEKQLNGELKGNSSKELDILWETAKNNTLNESRRMD